MKKLIMKGIIMVIICGIFTLFLLAASKRMERLDENSYEVKNIVIKVSE